MVVKKLGRGDSTVLLVILVSKESLILGIGNISEVHFQECAKVILNVVSSGWDEACIGLLSRVCGGGSEEGGGGVVKDIEFLGVVKK